MDSVHLFRSSRQRADVGGEVPLKAIVIIAPCTSARSSLTYDVMARGAAAWAFSLRIAVQVLKFLTKARMRVTPAGLVRRSTPLNQLEILD